MVTCKVGSIDPAQQLSFGAFSVLLLELLQVLVIHLIANMFLT